eukprot:6595056-Prymnesium_polylepis.1
MQSATKETKWSRSRRCTRLSVTALTHADTSVRTLYTRHPVRPATVGYKPDTSVFPDSKFTPERDTQFPKQRERTLSLYERGRGLSKALLGC